MIYFHDISHQQAFEKDGYTLVNLLSEEEVQALRALYFSNKEAHLLVKDKMHSTSDTHNTDLILAVDAAIKDIVLPKAAKVLKEFDVLLGGFLVKEAGMGSETGFHQDPTLVDDPKYVSANIWISLQDTNFQNGNLQLVKGSHRMVDCLVVTPQFPVFYDSFRSILPQYATNVPVKAGQAIVLNNKLIHGASANQTDVERLAVVMAIKSKAAAWTFHYLEPGKDFTEIEKYAIDLQAFASLEKNQRPKNGTFLGKMHFSFPQISETAFLKFMHANYGTESIWNRLKKEGCAMERIGPIFKNPANQAYFNKMGFVKIPLLDAAQVSALLQCYEQVKDAHEAINIPFITTSHSNNADLIGKVNQEILNIVENSILEEISNGEIIFSNFLIKKSGEKSESNPHQDLSIVDEQNFFPLVFGLH